VSTALDTTVAPGLTRVEAAARLAEAGPNVLAEPKRPSHIRRFAANLVHLFALLLWLGAALALLGGLPQLAIAIVVVILVKFRLRVRPGVPRRARERGPAPGPSPDGARAP
jgi:magnesium-transporting ATPase (P-type)